MPGLINYLINLFLLFTQINWLLIIKLKIGSIKELNASEEWKPGKLSPSCNFIAF